MELAELELEVTQAGRVFGELLFDHELNCSLLKLVLEYWPVNQGYITDRMRKTLQRRVRDEYMSRYGKSDKGSLEPVVRALVISTIWWWTAHPNQRELFSGIELVDDVRGCC